MTDKGIRIDNWGFFGLLILASALVHLLFIFFFPAGSILRTELFKGAYEPTSISAPLVFEFVGAGDEVEELAKKEELRKEEQEEQEEQETPEEEIVKRQEFVDTADSAVDEEVEAKTDMIGEKGTLARDNVPDEGPTEEEPMMEGKSDMPSLGRITGQGPGQSGGFAEMMPDIMDDISEIAAEDSGDSGEDESAMEGEETAEAGTEETTSEGETFPEEEDVPPEEEVLTTEASPQETQTEEQQAEQVEQTEQAEEAREGVKSPEEGTDPENKPGLFEEKLAEDDEGLLTTRKRSKELAYVPPMERQKQREAARKTRRGRKKGASGRRARKPKVAISFNAKTLSGGTIEPVYENKDANAPREGEAAFSVMKDEYAPYYRHIRDRITWYWILKYGTKAEINLETKKDTPITIEFKVYPDGTIRTVKVVEEAGNHLLASYIRDTIAETRLNKFPSYVDEEFIDVRFNFYFF